MDVMQFPRMVVSSREGWDLVARARSRSKLSEAEALDLATEETRQARLPG